MLLSCFVGKFPEEKVHKIGDLLGYETRTLPEQMESVGQIEKKICIMSKSEFSSIRQPVATAKSDCQISISRGQTQ